MWYRDTKYANALIKMEAIELLNPGLPETFNLLKKNKRRKQYSSSIIKQRSVK